MTGDDDFIGQLEEYLETFDGATPLPEHVRHEVHALLPGTRQVRPRLGPWRGFTNMPNLSVPLRWAFVATSVVVAVALGAALLNVNRSQGVASVTPTPSPTPAATSVVTQAPSPALLTLRQGPAVACGASDTTAGCIQPGTYALSPDVSSRPVTLTIPSGWFEWDIGTGSEGVLVGGDADAPDGGGWGVLFTNVGTVPHDPCKASAGTYAPADVHSVSGLVAAMSSWPGFTATTPVPVTVGGSSGQLIELTSSRTTATCPAAVLLQTRQMSPIDGYPLINVQPGPYTVQFRILDIGGDLLVIRTTDFAEPSPFEVSQGVKPDPTRHVSDQAALHAILDSVRVSQTAP